MNTIQGGDTEMRNSCLYLNAPPRKPKIILDFFAACLHCLLGFRSLEILTD